MSLSASVLVCFCVGHCYTQAVPERTEHDVFSGLKFGPQRVDFLCLIVLSQRFMLFLFMLYFSLQKKGTSLTFNGIFMGCTSTLNHWNHKTPYTETYLITVYVWLSDYFILYSSMKYLKAPCKAAPLNFQAIWYSSFECLQIYTVFILS